jgi:dihydrofolate reductase
MRKLSVFNTVTLDGYFTGLNGDLSWAHDAASNDEEWNEFVEKNASGGGTLLFGRVTYDMMVSYWPTPQAMNEAPAVARQMNAMPKVVFSKSLPRVEWENTTLLRKDLAGEVRRLKREQGAGITILGSGTIVAQLASAGLIDEYQIVVKPVVIGKGRTMFDGVMKKLSFRAKESRAFRNGNVLLSYEPAD